MTCVRSDFRNALLCVVLCMGALLLAWPFSGMAFNDDWTWAFTVLQLQKTGHLVYNGWSSPSVIAQAYWGLLWVKLLGFSFNVLRVSSLPLAVGSIAMCHALARRVGLAPAMSVFVTLMLGFSPLFMPMACTFMTDVPALFFVLLSMYALLRGFETPSVSSAIGWIIFGAVAGLIGGSSRQVVWIVPLIVLPYIAWLRRSDRWFAISACLALIVVFTGAVAMQHWFALQPYSLPDPPATAFVRGALYHPMHFTLGVVRVVLTTVLLLLPAAITVHARALRTRIAPAICIFLATVCGLRLIEHVLAHWTRHTPSSADTVLAAAFLLLPVAIVMFRREISMRGVLAACLFAAFAGGLWLIHSWMEPWLGNIVSSTGVMGSIALAGNRPQVVPDMLRAMLSVAVIAIIATLLASAAVWIIQQRRSAVTRIWNYFLKPAANRAGVPALLLTSLALLVLEMTRAEFDVAFDRHLLPLIPFLSIPLLLWFQQDGHEKLPIRAWAMLIGFGIFAFGFTQEVNALARARAEAIDRMKAAGVDDARIDAAFEHNYWVQVTRQNHVNDPRVQTPSGAYDKHKGPTPALDVEYRLESEPTSVSVPTEFGTVDYFSILPPFHRRFYIDRYTDRWWHYPERAATRPVERPLLPPLLLEQYRR